MYVFLHHIDLFHFSPDVRRSMFPGCEPRMLSVSSDHTMRQWNVKTGGSWLKGSIWWVRTTWDPGVFWGLMFFLFMCLLRIIIVVARCMCSFLCAIYRHWFLWVMSGFFGTGVKKSPPIWGRTLQLELKYNHRTLRTGWQVWFDYVNTFYFGSNSPVTVHR